MRKLGIFIVLAFTFNASLVKADEGMWLPLLIKRLNMEDMQKKGLKLTAEEIYSVNNSSLKDAIVALGGGFCTGEIISDKGLMLTNHHCGYDAIQKLSTPQSDYLTNGFWAMNLEQELPAGFDVWFLERMDDVTDRVLQGVKDNMSHGERQKIIDDNTKKILAEEGNEFTIKIKSFYHGNEFYMFKYNVFKDVRLVGTPPESIGKFGGDTDNWMWPRHTGDFSIFRVYADKDNKPAAYSKDNVPYKPKHHLPISLKGVQENDFAMILGYPGSTDRYLTSYGVKSAVEIEQPLRVKIRRTKLDIMEERMDVDATVRLQYASKHARVSNYWKYFLGQSTQLVNNKVYDKKKGLEDEFAKWVRSSRENSEKYGNALSLIEEFYTSSASRTVPNIYFQEAIFQGPDIFGFMLRNFGSRSQMKQVIDGGDATAINTAKEGIRSGLTAYYKDFDLAVDTKLLGEMLTMYYKDVDADYHPATLTMLAKKYKNNFHAFAKAYYAKSPFSTEVKANLFLDKFSKKAIEADLVYKLVEEFMTIYIQKVAIPMQTSNAKYEQGMRLFVDGLRKMKTDKVFASDANSTMRLTYGSVLSYNPKDAVKYDFITTIEGIMEKEVITDNKNHEFYVPKRLKELYTKKDYGQYALPNGQLPVGFLTNNDITGGNSGSPVINGNGELIGTAFDGNWEAMSGDIYFEPNLQRTISVDIRYTLFIVDKFAGAGHLVNEMTIIK
jgi:hypothetical protein